MMLMGRGQQLRRKLVGDIRQSLEKYLPSFGGLGLSTFDCLTLPALEEFHQVLFGQNHYAPKKRCRKRPECPLNEGSCPSRGSEPLYFYKKKLVDYIAQGGFKFNSPADVPFSLLEATANYLESQWRGEEDG